MAIRFSSAYFNQDAEFGTYLDNLHVDFSTQGRGIGTQLMRKFANEVLDRKLAKRFCLWVLDTNLASISYYNKLGGEAIEKLEANDIGDRTFIQIRYVWNNIDTFLDMVNAKNWT